jgi:hypothetical protein
MALGDPLGELLTLLQQARLQQIFMAHPQKEEKGT